MKSFLFLFAFAFAMASMNGIAGLPPAPIWLRQTGIAYDTVNKIYSVTITFQHGSSDSHESRATGFTVHRSLVGLTDKDEEFELVATILGDDAKPESITYTDNKVKGGVYFYFVRPMGGGALGLRSEKTMVVAPGSYCINMDTPQLTFTSFPNMVSIPGQSYSYELYAQHRSLRVQGFVRYELLEGPEGMTVDNKSGRVEWKTPADASGNYFVKVRSYSEDSKTAEAFQEWYIRFGNAQEVKAAIASNVPEDLVTNTLLMPNPAANNVTVQCNSSHEGIATMSIINSVGMEVFKNTVSLSYGSNSLQCNVSTLSSGTYLLRIGNGVALSTFPLTIVR